MVSSLAERLDAYLSPFVDSRDFSGVVILARGEEEAMRAYGFANVEFEVAHTRDTRYWAGSIAKLFTRAALLSLSRDGIVSLDDTLHRYLPDFPDSERITLAQL